MLAPISHAFGLLTSSRPGTSSSVRSVGARTTVKGCSPDYRLRSAKERVGMAKGRSLREVLRPKGSLGQSCGTAKIFQPTRGRESSLVCVEIHHRYIKPEHILEPGGLPIFIDSSNLALALKARDSQHVRVEVDLSPQNGTVYPKLFERRRFPVIAFSTDDKTSKSSHRPYLPVLILFIRLIYYPFPLNRIR